MYGDEAKFGGGKTIRDGMGQSATASRGGGSREVYGLNGLVNGALDDEAVRARALAAVREFGKP